jgi:hypothetical protein
MARMDLPQTHKGWCIMQAFRASRLARSRVVAQSARLQRQLEKHRPGREAMRNSIILSGLVLTVSIAIYGGQPSTAYAQQATIKRTDLARADQSATDVGVLWIAEIPPGGATGRHTQRVSQGAGLSDSAEGSAASDKRSITVRHD